MLTTLIAHVSASLAQAPDYFDVIKRPMDFGTIKKKLFEVEYMTPQAFLDDLRLVFSNCSLYNHPTAPEYQAGIKLQRYMERRVRELKLESTSTSASPSTSPRKASPSSSCSSIEPSTSRGKQRARRK